jgi:ABC-type Na+ efflux pump permease subunit
VLSTMQYSPRPRKETRKRVKTGIKTWGGQYNPAVQQQLAKRKGVKAASSSGVTPARAARRAKIAGKVNRQAARNTRGAVS